MLCAPARLEGKAVPQRGRHSPTLCPGANTGIVGFLAPSRPRIADAAKTNFRALNCPVSLWRGQDFLGVPGLADVPYWRKLELRQTTKNLTALDCFSQGVFAALCANKGIVFSPLEALGISGR